MGTQLDQPAASLVRAARGALSDTGHIAYWANRFGLLGDDTRLRVLLTLHQAPGITVGDLADAVGISQNAVSHSLSGLRATGMISNCRDGRFRRWSVTDPAICQLLRGIGPADPHGPAHPAAFRPHACQTLTSADPSQTGTA